MNYAQMSVSERRLLPPAVAVSTVAFALHPPAGAQLGEAHDLGVTLSESTPNGELPAGTPATLWLPLVRRTRAPFAGDWALPGGPIPWNETLADTSVRTLNEAVQCEPGYLEQLYSFGAVERSAQAQRLVTIAYWALFTEGSFDDCAVSTGGDPNVAWFSADRLPSLAFDHGDIVAHALDRLRSKTEYSTVAYRLLGQHFTLTQLREVREAILGEAIDPANFRRQALALGHLEDTGAMTSGDRHRPSRLYRFREDTHPNARNTQ